MEQLAGIASYIVIMMAVARYSLHPLAAGGLIAGAYFLLGVGLLWLTQALTEPVAIWQLITPRDLLLLVLQTICATVLVALLRRYEESLTAWAVGVLAGLVVLFYLLPALV